MIYKRKEQSGFTQTR